MKELIEDLEIKGYSFTDIYWLLHVYGFEIWVKDPRNTYMNKYYAERNTKALQELRIAVRYWIPK